MTGEAEVRQALREWIAKKSGKVDAVALHDDTLLLESRILTSLQVMDLILFIEELSGRSVDVQGIRPGSFRDIDSIYRAFFQGDGRDA